MWAPVSAKATRISHPASGPEDAVVQIREDGAERRTVPDTCRWWQVMGERVQQHELPQHGPVVQRHRDGGDSGFVVGASSAPGSDGDRDSRAVKVGRDRVERHHPPLDRETDPRPEHLGRATGDLVGPVEDLPDMLLGVVHPAVLDILRTARRASSRAGCRR